MTASAPAVIDKDQQPACQPKPPVPQSPSRLRPHFDQAITLGAALLGGALLSFTPVPAPWLTGAMLGAAIAGIWRPLSNIGPTFRDFAFLLAGLSLGCAVRPATLRAFTDYPLSLTVLVLGVVLTIVLSAAALMRFFGWRRADAIFASAPGALSTVLILASSEGADLRRVIVVQLMRLFALVACLPSIMVASGIVADTGLVVIAAPLSAWETAEVFALGIAASYLAILARFPSPWFMGPMLAAASLTGSGIITDIFPSALATTGFVMIGAFIGVRFHGLKFAEIAAIFPAGATSLVITVVTAFTLAFVTHWIAHIPNAEALIAFAPGGLEAMTVLAFALHLDPVYIGAHHLARFLGIGLGLPVLIRFWPGLFGIDRETVESQAR